MSATGTGDTAPHLELTGRTPQSTPPWVITLRGRLRSATWVLGMGLDVVGGVGGAQKGSWVGVEERVNFVAARVGEIWWFI